MTDTAPADARLGGVAPADQPATPPPIPLDAPGDYVYKSHPFRHQHEEFMRTRDLEGWCSWWEMGCGKSKVFIDTGAYLFEKGEIDGIVVFAPATVAVNWVTDELPKHMPDRVLARSRIMLLESSTRDTPRAQQERTELLKHDGLAILITSYSALMTKARNGSSAGKKLVRQFLEQRTCLHGLDESQYIKDPGAKRTMTVRASGKLSKYRRCLSGTPVAVGPFDLYSQVAFAYPDYWAQRGLNTFAEYKQFFGVYEGGFGAGGRSFQRLVEYKNEKLLAEWLPQISSRVTKDQVLDLPPKVYTKRYFELTRQQRELYEQLRSQTLIEFQEQGWHVEAPLAIQKMMRLYQITCGYVGVQDEDGKRHLHRIPGDNPRLETAKQYLSECTHQGLMWCWFRADVDALCDVMGKNALRFDGSVSQEDRLRARQMFQAGDVQWLILNTRTSPEGLNLTAARLEAYYNNGDDLTKRKQSEDRAHRIGTKYPVTITDFVCPGTVCEKVVRSMVKKQRMSDLLLGDKAKDWL
jgi:SNF2 family DNA or RNA helicase